MTGSRRFDRAHRSAAAALFAILAGGAPLLPADRAAAGGGPVARIVIADGQFSLGGHRIWINGANTPWHLWNDFGGRFDAAWWDAHFRALHEAGINATRVWISCSGDVGVNIDADGMVSGATPEYWRDLDRLFAIAAEHRIFVQATLMSFDNFKDNHAHHRQWRRWLASDRAIDSYVDTILVPLLARYGQSPWLWSIDLMNEPEWVFENAECGRLPWERLQAYFARAARAIHRHSAVLVTIGMAMPKDASDTAARSRGNQISDRALQASLNDPGARLDFTTTHYYDWNGPIWGVAPYVTPGAYGLPADKPAVIGEITARGSAGHTPAQDYEAAFAHGWQGVMAWSSNGVDKFGDLTAFAPATRAFRDRHPELVRPDGS